MYRTKTSFCTRFLNEIFAYFNNSIYYLDLHYQRPFKMTNRGGRGQRQLSRRVMDNDSVVNRREEPSVAPPGSIHKRGD
ncbi:hypothetical protein G6F42_020546 [Rhizopus arrhizus]|nr:hypothetical protein G6F42_020546 [Rhizopus arrhizus]